MKTTNESQIKIILPTECVDNRECEGLHEV